MIERYDPVGRMLSLRQMMDRLLEDAFVLPREGQTGAAPASGGLNVYEEGDDLIVEAQLPGTRPEDIQVTVDRGTLTIRGETTAEQERKDRNYLIREVRRGSFQRSLRLPDTVDPDSVQATFDNGVLRLTFRRSAHAQPRRIAITAAGQPALDGGAQMGRAGQMSQAEHTAQGAPADGAERPSETQPAQPAQPAGTRAAR